MAKEYKLTIDEILSAFHAAFGKDEKANQRAAWGKVTVDTSPVVGASGISSDTRYTYPPPQTRAATNDHWSIIESTHWLSGVTYFIDREVTNSDGTKRIRIVIGNKDHLSYKKAEQIIESGTDRHSSDYSYKESFQATGSDTITVISDEHNTAAAYLLSILTIGEIPRPTPPVTVATRIDGNAQQKSKSRGGRRLVIGVAALIGLLIALGSYVHKEEVDTRDKTIHDSGMSVGKKQKQLTDRNGPSLAPKIVRVETFRKGVLVFFRLFFTDPNNDATGFGFRGANGAGWAEESHLFSSPSYGRVSPGIIEYPFNHGCGMGSEYESDVKAWIYDHSGLRSPSVTVHLECHAQRE